MQLPLTVAEAARLLRSGTLSSVELTRTVLERADQLDPVLGVFVNRFDDTALAAAAAADAELRAGRDRGPLHGIPIGIKDILASSEGPTTAQSEVLDPAWGHGKDAPAVRRLKEVGGVVVGKVSTMEFAAGFPDPTRPFPIPRNPWDTDTWPGGSSSGSASGVAAGLFLAAIGTDTGGSIRLPAAFCGTSGLMPTFGRVPKSGCVPLGFSLDHVGALGRTAWDCAAMLDAISGPDPSDPSSINRPMPGALDRLTAIGPDISGLLDASTASGLRLLEGVRVGVMRDYVFDGLVDPAAPATFSRALATISDLGAELIDVTIPLYREVVAAGTLTMISEAFAYHRNDLCNRWHDYFPKTREIVGWGPMISGPDYVQAQRVRRVGQRVLGDLFTEVDVIVSPTATIGGWSHEEIEARGIMTLFAGVHTSYWDMVGNPVFVVPIGFTDAGLPLSLQIGARPFEEVAALRVGHAFQAATDWHLRLPPMRKSSKKAEVQGEADDRSSQAPSSLARISTPAGSLDTDLVRALYSRAGIVPDETELGPFVEAFRNLSEMVTVIYGIEAARYETPALQFDPAPIFGEWS